MSSEIRAVIDIATMELSSAIGAVTNESHVTESASEIRAVTNESRGTHNQVRSMPRLQ
jgi:hypothetical protein